MSAPLPSPDIGSPPAEVDITADLVRALLTQQCPELCDLPLALIDAGFDNAMYRLGHAYAVRLPRRQIAAALLVNEQTWLPHLITRLPIPIPAPVQCGVPGYGYPWKWSVLPWLTGTAADLEEPAGHQAETLARFLRALHVEAPDEAPVNAFRGVRLDSRAVAIEARMARLDRKTDLVTPPIRELWASALEAPVDVPVTWLHGDLHARNVLVEGGAITGIIDWGDITSGDAATDLASIWMLLKEPEARRQAIETYGPISPATLTRAKGWAILFGVLLLDTGLIDHPRHAVMGERTLRRVAEDGNMGR